MQTPPPTTLDTPSPTETQSDIPPTREDSAPTDATLISDHKVMASRLTQKPIYMIVATAISPSLGIGLKGTLPWPQIRSDMAFFRKATTGPSPSPSSTSPASDSSAARTNAVIMGRKTWDSIPAKFRPLPGRINIVLTRADAEGVFSMGESMAEEYRAQQLQKTKTTESSDKFQRSFDRNDEGALFTFGDSRAETEPVIQITNSLQRAVDVGLRKGVGKVFCIGGAEIYGMMLKDEETRRRVRVLQTEVRRVDGEAFECDTFFPEMFEGKDTWRRAKGREVKEWVETELPQNDGENEWAKDEKAGVEIRVGGWEATGA